MKRFYKILVIALAGVFAFGVYSCDNVNMYDQMVTPSTVDVEYSYDIPTPIRIAVTAGHDWYVQSTADWITVSNISNTGFTLNLEDYFGEGTEMRSGVVLVSSQIGQWPVVVNQERRPYSTPEELVGTYRMQSTEYADPAGYDYTLPFVATGQTYDYLTTSEYRGPTDVSGTMYDLLVINKVIAYEDDKYGTTSRMILDYNAETGYFNISPLTIGSFCVMPYYQVASAGTFMENDIREFGWDITIDVDTKQLIFIDPVTRKAVNTASYNNYPIYWQLEGYWYGDYVYGDYIITLVEQTPPAPAPAREAISVGPEAAGARRAKGADVKKGI